MTSEIRLKWVDTIINFFLVDGVSVPTKEEWNAIESALSELEWDEHWEIIKHLISLQIINGLGGKCA